MAAGRADMVFRSPGVQGWGGGGGYSDLCLLSELFLGFNLLNFAMFLVLSFFCFFFFNYFTGTYAILSRYFFGYANFHRNFGGANLKMFVFMAFL